MLKIGIVAGESSGDQLGAQLIEDLRALDSNIEIFGMCGPRMRAAGCEPLADIEELSVMGIAEVLRKYPELRRLRARLVADLLALQLDIFIGIDVPDFVHYIEAKLKHAGVKTAHLVAPQVWAWRRGRAKRLSNLLDLLLVLFPFESDFFTRYNVNTKFIGHPLVKRIPDPVNRAAACDALKIDPAKRYIGIMPGSRKQEIQRHVALFCDVANTLSKQFVNHEFLFGAVNDAAATEIKVQLHDYAVKTKSTIVSAKSHEILAASDAALVVSGTITMEALVSNTPMVVAIRVAEISYQILKRMIKIPFVAMPNVLAGKEIVPEFVQRNATVDNLTAAMGRVLSDEAWLSEFRRNVKFLRASLSPEDEHVAAREVLNLVRN